MKIQPPLKTWIWPIPPVARRLWRLILIISLYSALVYFFCQAWIQALPSWSSEFGVVNGIVMGILVGVRTRSSFDRWWDGQKLWTELAMQARNLALKVSYLVRADAAEVNEVSQILRAFFESLQGRLQYRKVSIKTLTGFENVTVDPDHVPAYLAGRLYQLSVHWHRDGRVDLPGLYALEGNIRALLDCAAVTERLTLPPVPPSFHALLRHGLILSLVLAPWHLIHALGVWAIPVQALIIYFLFGVEFTAEEIENPFQDGSDDLPVPQYMASLLTDVQEILSRGSLEGPIPVPPTDTQVRDAIASNIGEMSNEGEP